MKRNGFTLVEMLIALAIFGMITAAGVALLSLSARTQQTSDRLLDDVGQIRRVGALVSADLAHVVPRIGHGAGGRLRPAFIGGSGDSEPLLAFTSHRWGADDDEGLQRVAYRLRQARLERLATARDGATVPVTLIEGVRAVRLRYRDRDGAWRDQWDPSDPTRLPRGVELVTATDAHGIVRQLFLVGTERR